MIKWLAKFKYNVLNISEITWSLQGSTMHHASVVFKRNGFGRKKLKFIGNCRLDYNIKEHPFYHSIVIPWLHDYTPKQKKKNNVVPLKIVK